MRLPLAAAAFVLLAAAAQAQAPLTGTTAPVGSPSPPAVTMPPAVAPAPAHRRGHTLQERFDTANVTHDGRLTLEQARSKMPSVARDFTDIDTAHKGYVTLDEIREHSRAMRAAHRAARKAAAQQAPAKP